VVLNLRVLLEDSIFSSVVSYLAVYLTNDVSSVDDMASFVIKIELIMREEAGVAHFIYLERPGKTV
jgi:hypothetical protein